MNPDRALARLLRKPAVRTLLESLVARAGDGHALASLAGRAVVGEAGALHGHGAPIVVADEPIGTAYGVRREELAGIVAALAALDAETRAVAGESLARYRELAMLYEISERIIGAADVLSVATAVCEEAARYLDGDDVAVLLLNAETGLLEIVANHGRPFHNRTALEPGGGLLSAVLESGVGEIVNDLASDGRTLHADNALVSVVCSPLRVKERTLGVVVVGSEAPRHFNAGDLQLLNALAAQAATAIEVTRLGTELGRISHKPAALIYGVDDRPPLGVSVVLGVQHVFVALMSLAYPVLVALEAGGSRTDAAAVVSMSLLAMAVATALQVRQYGPIGAGYLLPHITSAIYLGPSLLAARIGGLGMVFAMTLFAGAVNLLLAPLLRRFRRIFPPEVSGVVVLMVGLSMVPVGLTRLAGLGDGDTVSRPTEWLVGLATLITIVVLTVAPLGRLRLYATAIGVALGYAGAFAAGIVEPRAFEPLAELPLFGLHAVPDTSLSFDAVLVIPFLAAALASSVKSAGLQISVQKSNDAGWKRPDTRSVSGGVSACGIGNLMSGSLGGVGVDVSAGSIGLAGATGCTARTLGYVIAAMLAALAVMPKATAAVALMPSPVMGAGLVYVACHLITSGAELISARMLDARRTYVIGLSLVAGVGSLAMPAVMTSAPEWAATVLTNPLALSTIVAVTLNAVLSLGVSSRARIGLRLDDGARDAISRFVDSQGAAWGARSDVIRRAAPAVIEWCEEARQAGGAQDVELSLAFDEFRLVGDLRGQFDCVAQRTDLERRIMTRYECTVSLAADGSVQFTFEH